MGIPDFLQLFLSKNQFTFKEIVQHSTWKRTYVLRVSKGNKDYILKAVSDNTPSDIKRKFAIEAKVYSENTNGYVPKMVVSEKEVIITEFIHGSTLREYLTSGRDIREITDQLVLAIKSFYDQNNREYQESEGFHNAFANLSSLAQSGPMQTKPLPLHEKVINKILAYIFKFRLKEVLKGINTEHLKSGFAHGDFHYNNIYVTEEKMIKFIDFENVAHNEYFDFDILYLLVMIEAKLGREGQYNDVYRKIESLINDKRDFEPVYSLYRIAASINPRFSSNPMKAHKRLLLLIKMITAKNAVLTKS